jgi:hypothetical protein
MNTKSKSKANEYKHEIKLVESDNPGGPWTEIPSSAIKKEIRTVDEVRDEYPVCNWLLPIDLQTELYDDAMDCHTGLDSNGLFIIQKRFGQNCTLGDIRLQLETNNITFDGKG